AVDRLHQIERCAQDMIFGACGDQARVGHCRSRERCEDACLASHRFVIAVPLVLGWSAQHVVAAGLGELQHNVVCPTTELAHVSDWACAESSFVHPGGKTVEIDWWSG